VELARTSLLPDVTAGSRLLARPLDVALAWMRPRDTRMAGRTVSALCAVGLVVTVLGELMGANSGNELDTWALALAGVSLLLAAMISAAAWFFDETTVVAWALSPFATILVIVLLDLATHDATVTAQIFLFFPTVYAAAMLPRMGAVLVTAAALAGEAVVVFSQLPLRQAAIDTSYVAAVLATTAVVLIRSSERQQELVVELGRLATVDPLTGLVTRRAFDEALATTLLRHDGEEGSSLLLLDVDRFKEVNDQYGHPGGDRVLVQLSQLLVELSRRGDVVCRLGGDEIALLLPRCTVDVALRRAEEMVETVRAASFEVSPEESIAMSISVGLAHAPTHGSDSRHLYAAADAALYEAKRQGRDRVVAA
jgi:diguanylate cyclase (GGDEF)-like protein